MRLKTLSTIGRGGFGVVEKVRDEDNGKEYARKTFKPSSGVPEEAHDRLRKRFAREVRIQAELGGNEVIPVLYHELDGPSPWFLMPLAEKVYEKQILEDRAMGQVNIDAIADILNGLEQLHKLGYVHRDLNPRNILLHDGHWKLADFGAALPPSGQTVTLTEGTIIYTEQYCSPEQRLDFHSAQTAADIYSFGCILHDIFGTPPRNPYQKHTAPGNIGILIEKCTEVTPSRRPSIGVLHPLLLDELIEVGGQCRVSDAQSGEWLQKLENVDNWDEATYADFARFFATLDISERSEGHQNEWVYSLSTPFLTRLSSNAIARIAQRSDGIAESIVAKYCEWARNTNFLFAYSDSVCSRLTAIFDVGTPAQKAMSMAALIQLAASHNRWFIMREALLRCAPDRIDKDMAKRLSIEIKTDEVVNAFRNCVAVMNWDVGKLAGDLSKLVTG